jgi:tetratricopeptide (TPR) repeat protein
MPGTSLPRLSDALAALLLTAQQPPDGQPQPMDPMNPQQPTDQSPEADKEAGFHFWAAVKLAQKHDYAKAIEALKEARKIHESARFGKLRKSQNPLTDPTETIFLTACDELLGYWQTRQQLVDANLLDKAQANEVKLVLGAVAAATEARKTAADLQTKLTDSDKNLTEAKKTLTDTQKTLTETMTKLTEAEKKVTETETALTDTKKKLTDAGMTLDNAAKALKLTGSEEPDIAKAIVKLDAEKKTAETDLKTTNDLLDGLKAKLVGKKYLDAAAKRTDLAGGLDKALNDANHPVVAAMSKLGGDLGVLTGTTGKPLQKAYDDAVKAVNLSGRLAKSETEVMKLGGELRERWTPGQMLDVWTSLLQRPANKDLSERALRDVKRVNDVKPTAEATYVKALAERSQGEYDASRATLKALLEDPAAGSEELRMKAKADYKKITEPAEFYVPQALKARDQNRPADAMTTIDEALKVFPPDRFAREAGALLAVRSALAAEQAAEQAPEKRDLTLEACVKDAEQAAKAGQEIEANYALGKVHEVVGDFPKAQEHYEAAIALLAAAKKAAGDLGDEAVRAANPASDVSGVRYHWARGQVIAKGLRAPATSAPVPAPKPKVPPTDVNKPAGRDGAQSLHFGGWQAWLLTEVLAADDQPPVPQPKSEAEVRADELMESAEKLLAAKDNRGYLLKGQALALKGKWTDGLRTYVMGLELVLRDKDHAEGMRWLMANHPAFKRPDPLMPPDVGAAEEHYARGLRFFFSGRYADAEVELKEAARLNDFDPKAVFFLGLAQLQQRRQSEAEEMFRLASRIEQRLGPQAKADVSIALERIQGPSRKILNAVREKGGQPGGL